MVMHFLMDWSLREVASVAVILSTHLLSLFAPFNFSWGALWTAVVLYVVTGMFGITLSYHRNLTHRSFTLPKWLEYTFAYCGLHALQGSPMAWVSTHRYHHLHCDTDKDPHSPTEGFWFSHLLWIFDHASIVEKCGETTNVDDLANQPFYQFLHLTYIVHPILLAWILYATGGFAYLVWGTGVRTVCLYHGIWIVNSVGHTWGSRPWKTKDRSTNNWWVALLVFGDGWHNNHHAFEYSARHGLEWWEVDMTWYTVRLLEALGLATNVKLPSKLHIQRMSKAANQRSDHNGGVGGTLNRSFMNKILICKKNIRM